MTIIDFLKEVKRIPLWDRTPAISDENLEDLINQADMDKKLDDMTHILFLVVDRSSIFPVDC